MPSMTTRTHYRPVDWLRSTLYETLSATDACSIVRVVALYDRDNPMDGVQRQQRAELRFLERTTGFEPRDPHLGKVTSPSPRPATTPTQRADQHLCPRCLASVRNIFDPLAAWPRPGPTTLPRQPRLGLPEHHGLHLIRLLVRLTLVKVGSRSQVGPTRRAELGQTAARDQDIDLAGARPRRSSASWS